MYQDPLNQGRARGPANQNPDNQESLSGHWQEAMDRAQAHWSQLTEEDVRHAREGRRELIEVLQERYGFSSAEADHHIETFLQQQQSHPRGWFERLAAMNGALPVNQYVSNPAPGPSARDDQPPSILPPDSDAPD